MVHSRKLPDGIWPDETDAGENGYRSGFVCAVEETIA